MISHLLLLRDGQGPSLWNGSDVLLISGPLQTVHDQEAPNFPHWLLGKSGSL